MYEGGIRSFVEHINEQKHCEMIHPEVIYMRAEKEDCVAEVAMQYNDSYNEAVLTFANNINTVEGGTHEIGFKTALTKVFNDYGQQVRHPEGFGQEPVGRGRARGSDGDRVGQTDRGAV